MFWDVQQEAGVFPAFIVLILVSNTKVMLLQQAAE